LIFSLELISQEEVLLKGTFNVGFEAGVQFTGVDDSGMPISKGGVGYSSGPFLDYYLSEIIKFRAGLYFDHRAFSLSDMGLISDTGYIGKSSFYDITEKYNVNYLTIPLSLIYVKGNDKFNFFIQGTFYYSIFLNSNQTGDFHIFISEEDAPHFYFEGYPEFNIPGDHYLKVEKNLFNTSDMGVNLLFGFTYYIKPNLGITLSPGFTYSFSNVWENPERNASWSRLYKINAGIVLSLGSK
tara:strand:+ start:1179 stop:1898 length:720 start_codon:yes stop_codon:yes gene_type:complete